MMTTGQLSKYLQVHTNTVLRYLKLGMPYYKIGREYRYELEEVKKWLHERERR